jgi:hypothetical protein
MEIVQNVAKDLKLKMAFVFQKSQVQTLGKIQIIIGMVLLGQEIESLQTRLLIQAIYNCMILYYSVLF